MGNLTKVLAVVMTAICSVWAQTREIGYPNPADVTATLENGTLTISGIGMMWDSQLNMMGCPTYVVIEEGVTNIGNSAFTDCYSLTSVTIGNSVTTIGDYAFSTGSPITVINVDEANTRFSSEDGVLFNKDKTTLVAYPEGKQGAYTIPNSVTSIRNCAFYSCELEDVTIPNSVTSIGDYAFSGCKLKDVIIPNSVKSIGDYAFRYCSD